MSSSSVISLGAWGGLGGERWSCIATSGIREITIREEGNIQLISWIDASGVFSGTFGASNLNSNAWGVERKVTINWPSEYLMSIRGTYGEVVLSLSFITNLRTYGPFGNSNSGQAFSIPISDSRVVGFYGRCGRFLDAIGIHVQPMNPRGSVTMGPWGGSGGDFPFSFQVDTGYIKRITVRHGGGNIKSLSFKDSNGRDYGPFGGQNPNDTGNQTVIDMGDSQRLTSISGTIGTFVGMTVVTSLSFRINDIMNGPYGTQTGTSFSIPMQGSEVIGFFGRSGHYLDSIGLYVR